MQYARIELSFDIIKFLVSVKILKASDKHSLNERAYPQLKSHKPKKRTMRYASDEYFNDYYFTLARIALKVSGSFKAISANTLRFKVIFACDNLLMKVE